VTEYRVITIITLSWWIRFSFKVFIDFAGFNVSVRTIDRSSRARWKFMVYTFAPTFRRDSLRPSVDTLGLFYFSIFSFSKLGPRNVATRFAPTVPYRPRQTTPTTYHATITLTRWFRHAVSGDAAYTVTAVASFVGLRPDSYAFDVWLITQQISCVTASAFTAHDGWFEQSSSVRPDFRCCCASHGPRPPRGISVRARAQCNRLRGFRPGRESELHSF